MTLIIRPELPSDARAIHDLTKLAFAPMPFAAGDEQDVPGRLRDRGRLSLSLVAANDDEIVGHIAFSRMLIAAQRTDWYALGPVSVTPALQRTGIGFQLIHAGIDRLREAKALGVALTGDPAYYKLFGFVVSGEWAPPNEPARYFQMLRIGGVDPAGALHFDPAFYS